MSDYTRPELLIETDELARRLGAPELRIFDCTTHLDPDPERVYTPRAGREDYEAGHVPGSAFIDLQGELSAAANGMLRFTFPSPEHFAAAMSAHGVGPGHEVVLYSTAKTQWATRVWWMLRAFGFERARVLNGGFAKWRAEGRAVERAPSRYPPADFQADLRPAMVAYREDVLAGLENSNCLVVNALAGDKHRGEGIPYGRPGRIAGSVNLPADDLLDAEGLFLPADQLEDRFAALGIGRETKVITYCGGGIAATADSFALALLGYSDGAMYDNSMSEWANDAALPMATG